MTSFQKAKDPGDHHRWLRPCLASLLLVSPPPKTTRGSSWRTAPSAPSPREQPCCRGDDAKNSHQTWGQRHGQTSPSPFRLGDIAGAGPHGPNALLRIPLKLRDGAHALSGLPPLLASLLLAPRPKKARPPRLGAGHERLKKTLRLG